MTGLLNADDNSLTQELLSTIRTLLNGELKNSNSLTQFRLLLRLLASLTCVNVIDAAQLLAVVGRLLESCLAIATASTQIARAVYGLAWLHGAYVGLTT